MRWNWFSKQGTTKLDNRDAGGLMMDQSAIVALIIDGSSKGNNGAGFVNQWIQLVLDNLRPHNLSDYNPVVESMRYAHSALRLRFLIETACYSALVILKDKQQVWGINCGDCRVGSYNKDGNNNWLSKPHRLSHVLVNAVDHEHIVTKFLKARRFVEPDIISLEYSSTTNWILASDGYWENHMTDDRSCLRLSNGLGCSNEETDCSNWHTRFLTRE